MFLDEFSFEKRNLIFMNQNNVYHLLDIYYTSFLTYLVKKSRWKYVKSRLSFSHPRIRSLFQKYHVSTGAYIYILCSLQIYQIPDQFSLNFSLWFQVWRVYQLIGFYIRRLRIIDNTSDDSLIVNVFLNLHGMKSMQKLRKRMVIISFLT